MTVLLKSIATPIVWVLLLMFFCLILTRQSAKKLRYKLGRFSLFLGMCILFLFSIQPVSNLLVYSLECQYQLPSDEILSNLDVLVILGGGMHMSGGFREYPEAGEVTYSRLFNGIRIFKQSGARTLALCGGSPIPSTESESEVMKALALESGIQENKIITETESRNTMENAAELAKLLSSTEKRRIGLVTSALHILRSEKAFRKQFPNDTIVPIPVNYIYSPDQHNLRSFVPSADAFATSNYALHEWIGIIWYYLRY
jgi:uncharacterized SAM-binding protein YcdF (DUF218 family)